MRILKGIIIGISVESLLSILAWCAGFGFERGMLLFGFIVMSGFVSFLSSISYIQRWGDD